MSFRAGLILSVTLAAAPMSAAMAGSAGIVVDDDAVYPVALVSGYDFVKESFGSYTGLFWAIRGDLARDGVVLRILGSYDTYEYDVDSSLTKKYWPRVAIDGEVWAGDVMLGYQWVRGDFTTGIYLGVEHQDHDLSPDDRTNSVRGSETGFKVALDVEKEVSAYSPYFAEIYGSYSTAFDTYFVEGRLGLPFNRLIVGPEVVFYGDQSGDAQRVGAFLKTDLPPLLFRDTESDVMLSAGYQFTDDSSSSVGSEGVYVSLRFTTVFARRLQQEPLEPLK